MNRDTAYVVVGIAAIALLLVSAKFVSREQTIDQAILENLPSGTGAATASGTANSGEDPVPGSPVHDLPVEPAAAQARKVLASRLGIGERSIVILSVYPKDWPNACLGLEKAGEMCAQVITPGFEVTLTAGGKTYVYRTNQTGSVVRSAP